MGRGLRRPRLVAVAAVVGLALAACGDGGGIEDTDTAAGDCGELNIAINPWTGYIANAHVIGVVAESELGCTVEYPEVKEEVGWQGMADGEIDTIVENWGHADLIKKYIDQQKSVVGRGSTGNDGVIGWFVPQWMAEEYPDITDWKNLNKYADMFETSESGGKGQLLDGDPSYVTNDEALVKNLDLDFEVVVAGSEAALIDEPSGPGRRTRRRCSAYFYTPQWFAEVDGQATLGSRTRSRSSREAAAVQGRLRRRSGQGRRATTRRTSSNKLMSKEFAESGSPAWT